MAKHDGYYIGKDTQNVLFSLKNYTRNAMFYIISIQAPKSYPDKKLLFENALAMKFEK